MKLLVTGGVGFIGGNFIRYYLKQHPEDRVFCLDALTYAASGEALEELQGNPRFTFINGDIADMDTVEHLFDCEHPDMVVNFAAESHVDRSIRDPQLFLHTNVLGVGVLLDASRKYGVRRFHQVSTDEVYGDLPLDRPEPAFSESSPLHPSSPYSASKASADLLVFSYGRTFGLPVSISRSSNNYGPFQHPEKLIPLTIRHALANRPVPVYGTGENVRDWIFVEDHCAAIDRILQSAPAGELYNVGARLELSNLALVKQILRILGKPDTLVEFVADRPGHDRRYAIDPSKLENGLGWRAFADFEQSLRQTIRWYTSYRPWNRAGF